LCVHFRSGRSLGAILVKGSRGGQQGGIAGQEPAAIGLFAVYRDTMTGELHRFSAGARVTDNESRLSV